MAGSVDRRSLETTLSITSFQSSGSYSVLDKRRFSFYEIQTFLTGGLSLGVGAGEEIEEREICLKGAPGDEGGEGGGEGMNFGTGFLWLIERTGST